MKQFYLRLATGIVCLGGALASSAAPASRYLSEVSLTGRLGYDTNVFATEAERAAYPLANQEDLFWQTQLKVAGQIPEAVIGATLVKGSYLLTDNRYDQFSSTENNTQHRGNLVLSRATAHWKGSADLSLGYIDGSKETPRYLSFSSYGMAVPRERREQLQTNFKAESRWLSGAHFVRLNGSFVNFDLMTRHHSPVGAYTGWMNYVDRSDLWAGVGIGTQLKGAVWTLDYRRGGQYQQILPWATTSASNDYHRFLLSFEKSFGPRWQVSFSGGPDLRTYSERAACTERKDNTVFWEGSVQYKWTKAHSFSLTGRRWRWVSSSGRSTYDDSSVAIVAKSTWTSSFSTTLTCQWQESDYAPPIARRDTLTSVNFGGQYSITPRLAMTVDYQVCRSEDHLSGPTAFGKEFSREITLVGLRWSW